MRAEVPLDGQFAYTSRAVGFLAQPFFPPGIPESAPGPFSVPIDTWSPFNTGLQLDLLNLAGVGSCTAVAGLPNGITIFPGGIPLWKDGRLAGAIGVSGDGVDQDDLIAAAGSAGLRDPGGAPLRQARDPGCAPALGQVPAAPGAVGWRCAGGSPVRFVLALLAVLALALGRHGFADDVLVLKDGRKIPVTRLARRDGQVVFQTTRGETFSVPEAQVVSPPLASIPAYEGQLLVLKDGRRIPVTRLVRRGGLVLFTTARDEGFSVPEDQVVSPPLESIPSLDRPPAAAPQPAPAPPAPPPAPSRAGSGARPAAPVAPAAAARRPLPHPVSGEPELRAPARPLVDRLSGEPAAREGLGPRPLQPERAEGRPAGDRRFGLPRARRRRSTCRWRDAGCPWASGVSTANPEEPRVLRRRATALHHAAGVRLGRALPRPDRVPAEDLGAQGHRRLQPELPERRRAEPRARRRARGHDAPPRGRLARGGVRARSSSPTCRRTTTSSRCAPGSSPSSPTSAASSSATPTWARGSSATAATTAGSTTWPTSTCSRRTPTASSTPSRSASRRSSIANVFRQDFLTPGYTLSAQLPLQPATSATVHYDQNGFLVRPAPVGSVRAARGDGATTWASPATATSAASTSPTPSTTPSARDEPTSRWPAGRST